MLNNDGPVLPNVHANVHVNITDHALWSLLAPVAPALWWGVFLAFLAFLAFLLVLGKCINVATAPLPPESMLAMFMKGRSQPTRLANVHRD